MEYVELKPGEVVSIGDQIKFKVIGIDGADAVVGVTAPRELRVKRQEQPEQWPPFTSERKGVPG